MWLCVRVLCNRTQASVSWMKRKKYPVNNSNQPTMWLPWILIVFVHCFAVASPIEFGEIKPFNVPYTSTTASTQSFVFILLIFFFSHENVIPFYFCRLEVLRSKMVVILWPLFFLNQTLMTIISSVGNQFERWNLSYPSLLAVWWGVFIMRLSKAMKFH